MTEPAVPEATFKILLEYDGTGYSGWQRQKDRPTVQGEVEAAVRRITGHHAAVHGSGRTDAGVHALGQVAHFRCRTRLDGATIGRALNAVLPPDIAVRACDRAPDTFHARYDTSAKTYRYRIDNRAVRPAVGRQYAWHLRRSLDREAMHRALPHITGTRDFKAFEATGSPRSHTVRTVTAAELLPEGDGCLRLEITADGFLKFMVRNIVGTLAEVGLGRRTSGSVAAVLDSGDRRRAGPTAPAHGLFLVRVFYGEDLPERGATGSG